MRTDLAHKKTYPSLFSLHVLGLLPARWRVYGFARSRLRDAAFRAALRPKLAATAGLDMTDAELEAARDEFLARCVYRQGAYDSADAMAALAAEMTADEGHDGNRLYYFAIPPTVFAAVSNTIKNAPGALPDAVRGWVRVVVEKPFGRDSASSSELSEQLAQCFDEEQIYRIDHYLGKEMVQSTLALRFANRVFEPLWSNAHISNVQITFKEPFGTKGRGGYFDKFGIVRDVLQNHLVQVMSLIAMEPPVSLDAEDVRDEKVKVLRCIPPVELADTVLGQYGRDPSGSEVGYREDATVPDDSTTPTFAAMKLRINNARWWGVPFILKAGKALNERKAEVRIQFREKSNGLFGNVHNNELVIRIQPDEAVYLKVQAKQPGLKDHAVETELDLTYKSRYHGEVLPDAYARLILDVIRGDRSHFVRADELAAAWAIFTPVLNLIDRGAMEPIQYDFGSRGPAEADALVRAAGYEYGRAYDWTGDRTPRSRGESAGAGSPHDSGGARGEAEADGAAAAAAAAAGAAAAATAPPAPPATAPKRAAKDRRTGSSASSTKRLVSEADVVVYEGYVVSRRSRTFGLGKWKRRYMVLHSKPPRVEAYKEQGAEDADTVFVLDGTSTAQRYDSVKAGAVRVTGPRGELVFVPARADAADVWVKRVNELVSKNQVNVAELIRNLRVSTSR